MSETLEKAIKSAPRLRGPHLIADALAPIFAKQSEEVTAKDVETVGLCLTFLGEAAEYGATPYAERDKSLKVNPKVVALFKKRDMGRGFNKKADVALASVNWDTPEYGPMGKQNRGWLTRYSVPLNEFCNRHDVKTGAAYNQITGRKIKL